MTRREDAHPLAISAMAGMFPGAPDIDAFWQRIRAAEVAPLTDLGPRWGVSPERYLADRPGVPDRTYVDQAHCLPQEAGAGTGADLADRQARIGRAVLDQLLAGLPGPLPARTGLVLATEWTGAGWFEQAARDGLADQPDLALPPPPAAAYAPDRQLAAIAGDLLPADAPRLAVDTACASSLYGIDLARRLIDAGRADAVAVMGLTAWLPLFLLTSFSQLMALSPERRLLPYAADASGIMLGEACGVVLVEPLAQALAAGRPVLAVIRRLGLSADGADRSVFAPGRDGQRLMYRRAYPDLATDLDYLEGHGTATKLGDETELTVMREFFADRPAGSLPIGSVKGLIGHTLAAAGICSTIKALLMLRARELPPHNAVAPNPALAGSPLCLLETPAAWAEPGHRPRRIGVSCFGFGGSNAHVVLDEYRPEDWPAPAFAPLPWQKLAIVDAEGTPGQRLPAALTLEAQGLRMGPNFLKRLDPYQLLLTDLAHRIAERQPELAGDEEAGVVVGSNIGGALTLKLMRRALWLSHHEAGVKGAHARADRFGPKHSLESIASGLPNMCSGYPAFHFNLRGFHQTLSGGPGLFWESLALAPRWLDGACDRLLLGAGRMNKWSGETLAEGAALYLLQPPEKAGRPPLALIHAVIPGAGFADACAQTGLDPERFAWRRSCDLADDPLAEAAGAPLLHAALCEAGRWAAIEIHDSGQARLTALLEVLARPNAHAKTPQLPVTVPLADFARTGEVRLPLPAASTLQPTPATVSPALARQWLASSTQVLHGFFAAQRAALQLVGTPATPTGMPMARRLRSAPHGVIADPRQEADGSLAATLLVDESHPYFFDHPLDHVPGILMLEGLLQLAEWQAAPGAWVQHIKLGFRRFCEKDQPVHIAMRPQGSVATNTSSPFKGEAGRGMGESVCPDSPIPTPTLTLKGREQTWSGEVAQAGQAACRFELAMASAVAIQAPPVPRDPAATRGRPDAALLHKHHAENILVTPLFDLAGGLKACETLPPPAGHLLAESDGACHGMLYLLETTRQFVMLIAHTVWGVPLGLPMNLLSIQLELDRPAARGEIIVISHRPTPLASHEHSAIVVVETALHGDAGPLGRATIVAQALTRERYAAQRHQAGTGDTGESS